MAKTTVGEGLVTHEIDVDPHGQDPIELEMIATLMREFERINPRDDRDATAHELWSILDAARVRRPSTELTSKELTTYWLNLLRTFSERSKEWHAAAWLRTYYDYRRVKGKLIASGVGEQDLNYFSKFTDDMAILKERMWWRATAIPSTDNKSSPLGKSPEDLALVRVPSERPFAQRNEGRDRANAERKAASEAWKAEAQAFADEYWMRHPRASAGRAAQHALVELAKHWRGEQRAAQTAGEEWIEKSLPKLGTIRVAVKKPVRA